MYLSYSLFIRHAIRFGAFFETPSVTQLTTDTTPTALQFSLTMTADQYLYGILLREAVDAGPNSPLLGVETTLMAGGPCFHSYRWFHSTAGAPSFPLQREDGLRGLCRMVARRNRLARKLQRHRPAHAFTLAACPFRLNLHHTLYPGCVMEEAAPRPILRPLY